MARFSITTTIFFGRDCERDVFRQISSRGLKRLLFLVDKSVKDMPVFLSLVENFKKNGFDACFVEALDIHGEPTYSFVDELAGRIRKIKADAIIAVGGGSVMDAAKAAAIVLTNQGKAIDYRGMDKVINTGIPIICYPTTAGTGSEVTHTASLIDENSKTKLGINGRHVAPLFAVLMPELTFSCPRDVTVSSGLDAMLHAIEAVSAKTANAVSSMFGCEAFALLYNNFRKVLSDPRDYDAREGMLLGSYYAGIAMMNAGGGPASGISYPLGVHYHIPHGVAGGIFLPHVLAYNVSKGYKRYAAIYDLLPGANSSMDDMAKSLSFVDKFNTLYAEIGGPKNLTAYGVRKAGVGLLENLTMEQRSANLELNPVAFGRDEVRDILEKVL